MDISSHRQILFPTTLTSKNVQPVLDNISHLAKENNDPITLLFRNALGGEVCPGLLLYDVIRATHVPIIGIVRRNVSSIASIVLQGCDYRHMAKGSTMMIHSVVASIELPLQLKENTEELTIPVGSVLRKLGESLERAHDLIDIVHSHSSLPKETIVAMLNATTYLSAEEALRVGLIDEVVL